MGSLTTRMGHLASKAKDGIENLKKRNKTFAKVADTVQHSSLFRKKSKKKEEWIEMFDETSQLPYYVNSVTNESVWEKPKNLESETKRSSFLSRIGRMLLMSPRKEEKNETEKEENVEEKHVEEKEKTAGENAGDFGEDLYQFDENAQQEGEYYYQQNQNSEESYYQTSPSYQQEEYYQEEEY